MERHPDLNPMYTRNGKWKHEGPAWVHWSDGFFPGLMWIFTRRAEQGSAAAKFWMENAIRYTKPLEDRLEDPARSIISATFVCPPTIAGTR